MKVFPLRKYFFVELSNQSQEKSESYAELMERKISFFPTLNDFYEKNPPVDLVIIASPVHHHVTQPCQQCNGSFST
ncbi:MAG: hypothetical protein WBE11_05060 [Candidatus Aminicenantaceae bacterium]